MGVILNKIKIVNWILTRRCNLRCSYCRIVSDYDESPREYPKIKHFNKNEMTTQTVIEGLTRIKKHNPDCFHIFYGGEPLLRKDLPDIIRFCNDNDIYYTIITNNSDAIQPALNELLEKVEVKGLSSSVDPIIYDPNASGDRLEKSLSGLERLKSLKGKVKDLVAEITVDKENVKYLYELVKDLSDNEISSSITFIDISKSPYYDFANVIDENVLVSQSAELYNIFKKIVDEKLDVHMAEKLLPRLFDILPSEYDCKLEENLSNVTVDADGQMRLCLRIQGKYATAASVTNFLDRDGTMNQMFLKYMRIDKRELCLKCNWSCPLMSEIISKDKKVDSLIHSNKRS
jgi:MoaA/NifB/PqqE/SkfB family radical SAM enzyme